MVSSPVPYLVRIDLIASSIVAANMRPGWISMGSLLAIKNTASRSPRNCISFLGCLWPSKPYLISPIYRFDGSRVPASIQVYFQTIRPESLPGNLLLALLYVKTSTKQAMECNRPPRNNVHTRTFSNTSGACCAIFFASDTYCRLVPVNSAAFCVARCVSIGLSII